MQKAAYKKMHHRNVSGKFGFSWEHRIYFAEYMPLIRCMYSIQLREMILHSLPTSLFLLFPDYFPLKCFSSSHWQEKDRLTSISACHSVLYIAIHWGTLLNCKWQWSHLSFFSAAYFELDSKYQQENILQNPAVSHIWIHPVLQYVTESIALWTQASAMHLLLHWCPN